jgi:hypothetical protein
MESQGPAKKKPGRLPGLYLWLLLQFFDSEYPGYARVGEGRNSLGIERIDV